MDLKEKQKELTEMLFGQKITAEQIKAMSWQDLIALQQSAVQLMMANRKDEKKFKFMESKAKFFMIQVMERLKNAEELFVVCSVTHHLPYVVCDEKTFDDQIYLFALEQDAKAMVTSHEEKKIPLEVKRLENKQLLSFYVNLYSMGVNAMIIGAGKFGMRIQLKDFVKQPDFSKLEESKRPVINPQLQLTGMYFVQELRRDIPKEEKKNLKDMEEEIYANIADGRFIILVKQREGEDQTKVELPMLQTQDGKKFEPVFTDIVELAKFKAQGFKALILNYETIKKTLPADVTGIVINPQSIRLMLPVRRSTPNGEGQKHDPIEDAELKKEQVNKLIRDFANGKITNPEA